MFGVEVALVPHDVFQVGDLALINEQLQFAWLGKVGLRGEQRKGGQAFFAVAPHGGARHGQQRSAQAVTHGVDFLFRHNLADCVH